MASFLQYRYVGFSTEAKPTTMPDGLTTLPAGASFEELNTGLVWIWTGSRWHIPEEVRLLAQERRDEVTARLDALRVVMEEVRDLLKMYLYS